MVTVLGAGGAIADHLVPLLAVQNEPFRLVSRTGRPAPGFTRDCKIESVQADITDREQALHAIAGFSVVLPTPTASKPQPPGIETRSAPEQLARP
jgi:uncharacterized protein YbjT (DUF2867 family)